MKKLLLFLALAAAGLQAWALVGGGRTPEVLYAVGSATSSEWSFTDATARLYKKTDYVYEGFVKFSGTANGELKFMCQYDWPVNTSEGTDMWGASEDGTPISSIESSTPLTFYNNSSPDNKFKPNVSIFYYESLFLVTVDVTTEGSETVTFKQWTSSDVYEIGTLAQLKAFADCVNKFDPTIKAKLTADITDAMDYAIGWYEEDSKHKCYSGEFDGNFKTVKLAIDDSGKDNKGLFGAITAGAYIHDVTVTGSVRGANQVGGVVGSVRVSGDVNIFNCKNQAAITGSGADVAGIVGLAACTTNIKYCCNTGNVIGGSNAAALITGWMADGGSIKYTFASGTVSGDTSDKFARYNDGRISLYANATMTDGKGAMYYDSSSSTYNILNESEFLTIATLVNVGGQTSKNFNLKSDLNLAGESEPYMPIGTTALPYVGTFDGENHKINLSINNTTEDYQGLFGVVTDGVKIQNVVVTGSVTGHEYVGGIVGGTVGGSSNANKTDIWNCGNEATITGTKVGGIIGNNDGGNASIILQNCYNTGDINGTNEFTAAISGFIGGGWSNVRNCYNTGVVKRGDNKIDYFCGNGNAFFTNCYCKTTDKTDNVSSTNGTIAIVSDAAVVSGQLCWNLGQDFTQDLSEANHPTFGSKEVHAGKWFNDADWDTFYNEVGTSRTSYVLNLDETKTIFSLDRNFTLTAKNVNVARNIPAGEWIGLCLPFDYDEYDPDELDVRELTSVVGSGETASMRFSTASSIVAGKPYIVRPTADVTAITATDKAIVTAASTVAESGVNMIGNFAKTSIPVGSFYINTSSQLKKLTGSAVDMKGFRAYFTVGNNVKALTFDFEDDDATGISLIPALSEVDGAIYNVAGQRMNKMQKGINIINGKKILK